MLLAALAQPDRGFEQHGLKELVDITFEAAPAGVHAALIAAQKVDLPRKHAKAQAIVAAASASAATSRPHNPAALMTHLSKLLRCVSSSASSTRQKTF